MQTITTKYHGPTNTMGSRISATSSNGAKKYTHYDHSLTAERCHIKAAQVLAHYLEWKIETYAVGGTNTGYVFVPVIETVIF